MTEAGNDVLTATAYAFLHHHCSIGYTYRTRLWSSRRNHLRSWMSQRYQDDLGWLCKRHHKVAVNILLSTDHTTIIWTLICVTWGLESIPHAGSVNKTRCPFRPWLESISERIYAPPNWTISVNQWRSGRTFVALNAYGNVNISTFKIRKMEEVRGLPTTFLLRMARTSGPPLVNPASRFVQYLLTAIPPWDTHFRLFFWHVGWFTWYITRSLYGLVRYSYDMSEIPIPMKVNPFSFYHFCQLI